VGSVQDAWLAGTRPLTVSEAEPLVTVIVDGIDNVAEVASAAQEAVADGQPVDVRVSFAGPARGVADAVAEVAIIVQQVAIGAAGSGLWAAVETIVHRAFHRESAKHRKSAQTTDQRPSAQILTVVIPTRQGPALVQRVSVGAQDLDEGQLSIERIVLALAKGADEPPEVQA
jgi:hypothetical protein